MAGAIGSDEDGTVGESRAFDKELRRHAAKRDGLCIHTRRPFCKFCRMHEVTSKVHAHDGAAQRVHAWHGLTEIHERCSCGGRSAKAMRARAARISRVVV